MKLSGKLFIALCSLMLINSSAIAKTKKHSHHHHSHSNNSSAQTIYGAQNLAAELNQIVQNVDPHAEIGVQIKSMKTGDLLYAHNEQQLYTPASTLKILTAEAAYLLLGSDYKFPTKIVTDATTTANGVIDGNVYLVHSGDPSLTYYDLTDLMTTLKAMQIHTINGNVYVDNTAYDQDNFGPGWEWSDTRYCYAAPINASIINHNCISFSISPAKYDGRLAVINESPRFFYSAFNNTVVTKARQYTSCE